MKEEKIQYFNYQNSIYVILYNYLVTNGINFQEKPVAKLSKKDIRRYIEQHGVKWNYSTIFMPKIKVSTNDIVEIDLFEIKIKCIENKQFDDSEKGIQKYLNENISIQTSENENKDNHIASANTEHENLKQIPEINLGQLESEIGEYLKSILGNESIQDVILTDVKKAFAIVVDLFEKKGFEAIKRTRYSYELTDFLKQKIISTGLIKELRLSKSQINFSGKLIESLIDSKLAKEQELSQLHDSLIFNLYDKRFYKFLQEYNRFVSSLIFQYTIQPFINPLICNKIAIEQLIKPVQESLVLTDSIQKFDHYENNKEIFEKYLELTESDGSIYSTKYFRSMGLHLFKVLKQYCEANEEKIAIINVEPTARKYNFSNIARKKQDLFFYLNNTGTGLASNVRISSLPSSFEFEIETIGLLKPAERKEVVILSKINFNNNFLPTIKILIEWEDMSGSHKANESTINFEQQEGNIPWEELKKQKPYSISEIEDERKLFGRAEILEELKSNILSNNIESYKLWGQKRVGKSSIVKTLKSILKNEEKILVVYKAVGGLRNAFDPLITLNDMGGSLCSELLEEVDVKIKEPSIRERLRSIQVPTFNGSFNPLETFIKSLSRIDNSLKFVFILDEYDRLNEEFFLPGNLGETLSSSIGKSLNSSINIGFILVGSENMHLLDRQGINYNGFHEREVDTFDKVTEYNSFRKIVTGPTAPHLNFSDRAIERIYEASYGNPYFANIICANAFNNAYKNQDAHINHHAINQAIEIIINSSQRSHFEHFWGDGITEESSAKKESKSDIRRRILVSYSMSFQKNLNTYPTKNDLLKNFKFPEEYKVEKYEVENTIVEFYNRKIFYDLEFNRIRIHPLLFENWLCGPGKTLMIQGVSDLEALHREKELENEFRLKNEEIEQLSDLLIYQGQKIPTENFLSYFTQFGSPSEQRKIFNLLDRIFYVSQEEINEFIRKEQKNIFPRKELEIKSSVHTLKREGVEIYSLPININENEVIVESFKRMSRIRSSKTLKNMSTESNVWEKNGASEIIIVEPIVDDSSILCNELNEFLSEEIIESKIPVRIVIFVITSKAKMNLIKFISPYQNVKLFMMKEVEDKTLKPFIEDTLFFDNNEESNQTFAIVRKFFPGVDRNNLLVLLESICPSKSIPILWCEAGQFKPIFPNIHITLKDLANEEEKEKLRTRIYHANTILSQRLNLYIVNEIREKAKRQKQEDWFRVEFIPKNVLKAVSEKWIQEGQESPKESYFDFLDYRKIIELNQELIKIFNLPGEGLSWCDKLNVLRRDPAHPEKPAPSLEDVEYFEKIKQQILSRLS